MILEAENGEVESKETSRDIPAHDQEARRSVIILVCLSDFLLDVLGCVVVYHRISAISSTMVSIAIP